MKPVVFYVKNEIPIPDETFDFLLKFIQPEKRERILKHRVKKNADNMLIGEILSKVAIKNVFGIKILNQDIGYGEHGKPYLIKYPNIFFNVSHSGKYVFCAVCNTPIGIDIQKITKYNPNLAKRICSDCELNIIDKSSDKSDEFTRIWTRKEAYLKMTGTGITKIKSADTLNYDIYSRRIENYWLSVSEGNFIVKELEK